MKNKGEDMYDDSLRDYDRKQEIIFHLAVLIINGYGDMKNKQMTNKAFIEKTKEMYIGKSEESTEKQMLRRFEALVDYAKDLEESLHAIGH